MNINLPEIDRLKKSTSSQQKDVTILGSTGSIGCNTLDLIERNKDDYNVISLTAHQNVAKLAEQAIHFNAKMAVIADESLLGDLKTALVGTDIIAGSGKTALNEAADMPSDWVMSSIVGAAGLKPTLTAIRRGATIALANKECLVCAGDFMMDQVKEYGATMLPVDSEHNAIFQSFDFDPDAEN
jgi:1-deoxy-D-xylulose-5-phosphate reductoisomerase